MKQKRTTATLSALILGALALTSNAQTAANPASIKVLYVYTPDAADEFGGPANIVPLLRQIKDVGRKAMYYSTNRRVKLHNAGYFQSTYNGSASHATQAFRLASEYYMPEVIDKRDSSGADLVQLFAPSTEGMGGISSAGYWGTYVHHRILARQDTDFWKHVSIHELGHNFGGSHAEGHTLMPYGHTIMQAGVLGARVPRFSHSWKTYRDRSLGDDRLRLGNWANNNTATILENALTVAGNAENNYYGYTLFNR